MTRVRDEMEKIMVQSIEEYLMREEEMEDLRAQDEKIFLENEELKETLRKMSIEEEDLKERVGSRVREVDEKKQQLQEREVRAREERIALEKEISEKGLSLKKLSKQKSDLVDKLAKTEASALLKSQELNTLTNMKTVNLEKLKVQEEKERSLKEKVQQQAEKKHLLEEKIQLLKAEGAERRGEV